MPGELNNALLTVRVQGQSPNAFAPMLRRIALSINPMLQLTGCCSSQSAWPSVTVALVGDRMSGHALMDGTHLLLVPATAAFMLIVGLASCGSGPGAPGGSACS
jgi:hypothetical protein